MPAGSESSVASDADRVATETAIWLARLERGLQAHEGAELREWLRQSTHGDAIVEAAKLWHGPDIVAVLAELVPVGFGTPRAPRKKTLRPIHLAIGICLGLVMLAAPIVMVRQMTRGLYTSRNGQSPVNSMPWGETIYTTKPGEVRAVTLADGSKMTLNGHTRIAVWLGTAFRQATLDFGEAIFQISPQRQRPFEVTAAGRNFQAPPSMFDLQVNGAHSVELLVLDGGVTVRGLPWHWPATPAEARVFDPAIFVDTVVGPQQAALIEDQIFSRRTVTAANMQARLKWRPEDVMYVTQ